MACTWEEGQEEDRQEETLQNRDNERRPYQENKGFKYTRLYIEREREEGRGRRKYSEMGLTHNASTRDILNILSLAFAT